MNSDKLKDIISKKCLGDSDKSQRYFQLFYFERILERISKSKYKGKIILKGGLLLTSLIGDDERTTKDMDATIKGIPLTKVNVKKIFNEILDINVNDGVSFEIISVNDIRLEDEYGGFRLNILSRLDSNKTYITVELTTGDVITSKEMKYSYNSIFESKKIPIMAYTIETVLAEKLHAIMTKGTLTTRLKDFYDMYVLANTKFNEIDNKILSTAVYKTFNQRNSLFDIKEFYMVIEDLEIDENMKELWINYQEKNSYAKNVTYEETIEAIKKIINILEREVVAV